MGGTIFNIVTGYMIYFAIVFRRKKNAIRPTRSAIQVHDKPVLEFWWTVIPTILVLILAIFSTVIWSSLQNTAGDVLTMEAIGHQYYYSFRYPKLANPVIGEMHVPVNTPVTLHVTSAEPGDPPVNHGFWVPDIRIKADMVPGLINTLRFTPTQVGGPYPNHLHRVLRSRCTARCAAKFYIDPKRFRQVVQGQGGAQAVSRRGGRGRAQASRWPAARRRRRDALRREVQRVSRNRRRSPQKIVGPGLGKIFERSRTIRNWSTVPRRRPKMRPTS